MAAGRSPATRMELLEARRRLERVERGVELLRKRREALVRELFELTRPAAELRSRMGHAADAAYGALLEALGAEGAEGLRAAGRPRRRLEVELEPRTVWGLSVPELGDPPTVRRSIADRGLASTRPDPAPLVAAERFEELVEFVLSAASGETLIRRLGQALRRTSRQVHSLERRLGPALDGEIRRIESVLEEREREERVRLRRLRPG